MDLFLYLHNPMVYYYIPVTPMFLLTDVYLSNSTEAGFASLTQQLQVRILATTIFWRIFLRCLPRWIYFKIGKKCLFCKKLGHSKFFCQVSARDCKPAPSQSEMTVIGKFDGLSDSPVWQKLEACRKKSAFQLQLDRRWWSTTQRETVTCWD